MKLADSFKKTFLNSSIITLSDWHLLSIPNNCWSDKTPSDFPRWDANKAKFGHTDMYSINANRREVDNLSLWSGDRIRDIINI